MPQLMINDCTMHYEEHGTGQNTVLFLHGLFMNSHMFNQQMVALRDRFRCVMVDLRGQGSSSAPLHGYDLKAVASDVIQFINVRRYGSCHIVGASMGGILGMYIAIEQPKLVQSLTLLGSTAEQSPSEDRRKLKARSLKIKLFGMRFAMPGIMNSLFSHEFLNNPANKAVTSHWRTEILKTSRRSIVKVIAGVLQRKGIFDQLFKIPSGKIVHPHTDLWMSIDSKYRRQARDWLRKKAGQNTD